MKQTLSPAVVVVLVALAPAWRARAEDANDDNKSSVACFMHGAKGEFHLALSACNAAIAIAPKNPQNYVNPGSAYLMIRDRDRALEDFETAIRLNPDDGRAYFNRGLAHTLQGQRQKAIQDYSEAIRLRPRFAAAYNNRGYLYELLGMRDEARSDYEKAFQLDPSLPTISENLDRLSGSP
jgi:tetratricopeptide (TPR) repeat protein